MAAAATVSSTDVKIKEMIAKLTFHNRKSIADQGSGSSSNLSDVLDGQTDRISCLKSKEEKIAFLTAAIDRADWNLVTSAILHMKNTLSRRLFHRELVKKPEAEEAYINYLRITGQIDVMMDFLTMTGRHEEAAITKLKQCLCVSGVETRVRMLRNCKQNFLCSSDVLDFWGSLIEDEATLLERQLPIEEEDRRIESQPTSEMNAKFLEIPRKPLVDLPVITTLFYCCLYHWDLPENYLSSPASIRKTFDLSERQYVSTALAALSMRKRWDLVDGLFQGKTWLGLRKLRVCLQFQEIARTLIKYEAPPEVVNKYALMIEDADERRLFAEQNNLHKVLKGEQIWTWTHVT
jgi:hypothetical protein